MSDAHLGHGYAHAEIAHRYTYSSLIWALKASMLLFYKRIVVGNEQLKLLKVIGWFCFVTWIAVMLTISLGCQPYDGNWTVKPFPGENCTLKLQNVWATSILNIVTDLAILAIPLPLLVSLRLPIWKKLGLSLCFVRASLSYRRQ